MRRCFLLGGVWQIAWTAAAGTNGKLTRQMRLGTSREGRDLLVPNMHPLDLVLSPQRVGEAVEAIADNAIDPLDSHLQLGSLRIDRLLILPYCPPWPRWPRHQYSHQPLPILAHVILPDLLHACRLQSAPRNKSLIEVGNVFALIENAAGNAIVNARRERFRLLQIAWVMTIGICIEVPFQADIRASRIGCMSDTLGARRRRQSRGAGWQL